MKAMAGGHRSAVHLLLSHPPISLFLTDQTGRTALDWGRLGDKQGCCVMLESAMEMFIVGERTKEFGRVRKEELERIITR